MMKLLLLILSISIANAEEYQPYDGSFRHHHETPSQWRTDYDDELYYQRLELQRQQEQTREFTERYQDMQYDEYPYAIRY
jgi:hypothetical protein